MRGRLIPASGGPVLPLSVEAVKLAARRTAQKDFVEDELAEVMVKMARVNKLEWPASFDSMSEMEKEAFIGALLRGGRGLASRMAGSGIRPISRIGQHLQRNVRSPVQIARSGRTGVTVQARSPLAATPPPTPHTRPGGVPGGPMRTPAQGAPTPTGPPAPTVEPRKGVFERMGGRIQERVAKRRAAAAAKRKSAPPPGLIASLVPGALLAGGAYGLYKGVPAAVRMATEASRYPMAPGLGFQQYRYGYTPEGQAQF